MCERCFNREAYSCISEKFNDDCDYAIESKRESRFYALDIAIVGKFEDDDELKRNFPWLKNIWVYHYSPVEEEIIYNLCDDCVLEMMINREAISIDSSTLIFAYTACCDKKYFENDKLSVYRVNKINNFPYLSYYEITDWEDIDGGFTGEKIYLSQDYIDIKYHLNCTICKECLYKVKDLSIKNKINIDTILFKYSLKELEIVLFSLRMSSDPNVKQHYIDMYYIYNSLFNNLSLKNELAKFIFLRNLNIVRSKYWITKDLIPKFLDFVCDKLIYKKIPFIKNLK